MPTYNIITPLYNKLMLKSQNVLKVAIKSKLTLLPLTFVLLHYRFPKVRGASEKCSMFCTKRTYPKMEQSSECSCLIVTLIDSIKVGKNS